MTENSQSPYWIGFDLGGTKMLAVVYDSQFRPLGRERKRTKGHGGPKTGMARILKAIGEALEDADVTPDQLAGIGVGFPGPVNMETGELLEAVNLGWEGMPLRATLEKELGCPAVVANDVDLGVYAEYRFGAAKDAHSVLGVFPGTGVGGGFVYQGKIFRGRVSSCMEIGHIQIDPMGQLCGCGRYGCLETETSRLAVSAEAAKAAYRGEAMKLREIAGTDLSEIRSGALSEAVKAGETVVENIIRRAAEKVGTAVANAITMMAPDVVVLGGGLVEAMPELFVETVTATAKNVVMPPYADVFTVVAAKLGDDANVLGAAAWAEKCLAKASG